MIKNSKKGFSIIELVLVLAVAGLIFLIVFIALPALQRSQRNTRRRQDMARILSAVNDYETNHNGKSPVSQAETWNGYTGAELDKDFPARYIEENLDTNTVTVSNYGMIGRQIYSFQCQDNKSCDRFMDPDGAIYKIAAVGPSITGINGQEDNENHSLYTLNFDHVVYIGSGVKCGTSNEGYFEATDNPSDTVVRYVLEGGSVYCTDNQ